MLPAHVHSVCQCPCCLSRSMVHVHVHGACSCLAACLWCTSVHVLGACPYAWFMAMPMLHVLVHGACPCPWCMSMPMVHGHVHATFPSLRYKSCMFIQGVHLHVHSVCLCPCLISMSVCFLDVCVQAACPGPWSIHVHAAFHAAKRHYSRPIVLLQFLHILSFRFAYEIWGFA